MADGLKLGGWVLARAKKPTTHLKIQKLTFYAYGAAIALGCKDVGEVSFHKWKHGPVSLDIWDRLKQFGGEAIAEDALPSGAYCAATQQVLGDALAVYDRLTAWELRCESHLEAPWTNATFGLEIPQDSLRAHFENKFAGGQLDWPTYSSGRSSYVLDGLPRCKYGSLKELANASRLLG